MRRIFRDRPKTLRPQLNLHAIDRWQANRRLPAGDGAMLAGRCGQFVPDAQLKLRRIFAGQPDFLEAEGLPAKETGNCRRCHPRLDAFFAH